MKARLRRSAPRLIGIAVVLAVFGLVLPRIADYRDVVDVVRGLSSWSIAALVAAATVNVITFAPPWMAALSGLGFVRALVMTQAATAAASVFPGGEAVGIGLQLTMLRTWRFPTGAVTAAATVLTAFNLLVKVLLPVAAVIGLVLTGAGSGPLGLATVVGVAVLGACLGAAGVALRTKRSTAALGALLDRLVARTPLLRRRPLGPPLADRLVRFRAETFELLRRRWLRLALWTLTGHLSVFLVLLVALRAVGVEAEEVSTLDAFAAWALVRLVSAVPITPGGIGVVELGLTAALVTAGGANDEVVAAVLLFRLLTWLPPIALGVPAALVWRRLHPAARAATPPPA
jgi:uncharacterized protein (TIRG00374 family)